MSEVLKRKKEFVDAVLGITLALLVVINFFSMSDVVYAIPVSIGNLLTTLAARMIIFKRMENFEEMKVKISNLYETSCQVVFDLKRDKRVYIEVNGLGGVAKGIIKINPNNKLELAMRGAEKPHVIEQDNIDDVIHSFLFAAVDMKTILVKEDYINYMEQNKCSDLLFCSKSDIIKV